VNVAAPLWLVGAGVLSALVVLLHLLARRRPRPLIFPTARFIPERSASAPAAARRPSDLLLLLLRVAVVLLLGAAFARPFRSPPRRTALIVALDRSRAASRSLDDSTRRLLSEANLVVAVDSVPHHWDSISDAQDTTRTAARGSLSAALLAAVRSAPEVAVQGDSLSLVILSPFAAEEWDAATLALRRLWQGGIAVRPIPSAEPPRAIAGGTALTGDDPLRATLALLGRDAAASRVLRTHPGAGDSSWAAAGGALVYWPRETEKAPWMAAGRDTVGGVLAGGQAVVAPFFHSVVPPNGAVVARWADGTPAATERRLGSGCERDVAIPTDLTGDLMIRASMLALTRELAAPCGGRREYERVPQALLDSLRGPPMLLPASRTPRPAGGRVPANGWLLVAALVLFASEPAVRRGGIRR
jgi:hypothetical protein